MFSVTKCKLARCESSLMRKNRTEVTKLSSPLFFSSLFFLCSWFLPQKKGRDLIFSQHSSAYFGGLRVVQNLFRHLSYFFCILCFYLAGFTACTCFPLLLLSNCTASFVLLLCHYVLLKYLGLTMLQNVNALLLIMLV